MVSLVILVAGEMIKLYLTLGEAYCLKVLFNNLWAMPDKPAVEAFLGQWYAG
jgi:hypothetical protein